MGWSKMKACNWRVTLSRSHGFRLRVEGGIMPLPSGPMYPESQLVVTCSNVSMSGWSQGVCLRVEVSLAGSLF